MTIMLKMKKKVVVVGGGTGTSVLLTALKDIPEFDLTAIVTVTDNGGSTGRLRDEFGFLPVGDMRQCLAALADGENQEMVRQVLLYRFEKGTGLKGHNLGNLILTALEDLAVSPAQAIEIASKIFRTKGQVLPVSEDNVNLEIEYQDGSKAFGEHILDLTENGGKKIIKLSLNEPAQIYSKAEQTLLEADLVVIGPGDLYASLIPNLLVTGFSQALQKSPAKFIYLVNLMTHYSQTYGMSASDHVAEIGRYAGRKPDYVVINNGQIPESILAIYKKSNEVTVADDLPKTAGIIRRDLVLNLQVEKQKSDELPRSVLRHDPAKIAALFRSMFVK